MSMDESPADPLPPAVLALRKLQVRCVAIGTLGVALLLAGLSLGYLWLAWTGAFVFAATLTTIFVVGWLAGREMRRSRRAGSSSYTPSAGQQTSQRRLHHPS